MENVNNPKVTVVTVTYNAEAFLEDTISSIINQTYNNIEYIIVDGKSTDKTLDIIKKYEKSIALWISEKDNGIYDAMNKAIGLANGEWIIFMNAGDSFCNNKVIQDVFKNLPMDTEFIYGDMIWKNEKKEHRIKAKPLTNMWKSISFSHQSLFSKTSYMKKNHFDLTYPIVADYNFYYEAYVKGKKFHYSGSPVAKVLAGGFSDQSFYKRTFERWSVVRNHNNSIKNNIYYLSLIVKYFLKNTIKKASA